MLEVGASFCSHTKVDTCNVASAVGSGNLEVFATPMMVALMENAAMNCVTPFLSEGTTTVGGHISTSHIAPSPLGAVITSTATLTHVENKKLTFSVVAKDGEKTIGEGTHVRFIVEIDKFLNKFKK